MSFIKINKLASKFEEKYKFAQTFEEIWKPEGGPRPPKVVWLSSINQNTEKNIDTLINYTNEVLKTANQIEPGFSEIQAALDLFKKSKALSSDDRKEAENNLLLLINKKRSLIEKLISLSSIVKSAHDQLYLKSNL